MRPKSVSHSNPCPLCSHADWCFTFEPDDYPQGTMHVCMRSEEYVKGDRFTSGGSTYVVCGKTKTGGSVFETVEQADERRHARIRYDKPVKSAKPQPESNRDAAPDGGSILPPAMLNRIFRRMLELLVLEEDDKEYLRSEGFKDEFFDHYLIRTFPESDGYRMHTEAYHSKNIFRKQLGEKLHREFGSLEGVPGAYLDKDGKWTFSGLGGILFPVFDYDGNIVAVRIRIKRRWFDPEGREITKKIYQTAYYEPAKAAGVPCRATELGKYMYMSSYKEDPKAGNNIYRCGTKAKACLGVYRPIGNCNRLIYITEGEKKSIIASNALGVTVIDVPGVGMWNLLFDRTYGKSLIERLKEVAHILIVAYDADKEFNKAVLNFESGLCDALKGEGFTISIASWDSDKGKGLDDLLNNGYKPEYSYV